MDHGGIVLVCDERHWMDPSERLSSIIKSDLMDEEDEKFVSSGGRAGGSRLRRLAETDLAQYIAIPSQSPHQSENWGLKARSD